MGLERFEVEKSRVFFQDFLEILEITEILELGFHFGRFLILGVLLRNLILVKMNLCSCFPAQELTHFKNWLRTLDDLSIVYHFLKRNILYQNPL